MPVADHPIHESTRLVAGAKYGCWNKPRKRGYWVKDGWSVTRLSRLAAKVIGKFRLPGWAGGLFTQRAKYHVDPLTKHCCYDQRANDPRCLECLK